MTNPRIRRKTVKGRGILGKIFRKCFDAAPIASETIKKSSP
jgi:hypothetical protein